MLYSGSAKALEIQITCCHVKNYFKYRINLGGIAILQAGQITHLGKCIHDEVIALEGLFVEDTWSGLDWVRYRHRGPIPVIVTEGAKDLRGTVMSTLNPGVIGVKHGCPAACSFRAWGSGIRLNASCLVMSPFPSR